MINNISKTILGLALMLSMAACNLTQDVNVELPNYEERIFVECYLEPGENYRLLLTKSSSYFDAFPTDLDGFFNQILEEEAVVEIHHGNDIITLENTLDFNFFTGKVNNYISSDIIPADYGSEFELYIRTKDGEDITATTTILEPIPIDSIVIEFSEEQDTAARALTYFHDVEPETNYVRRMLHYSSLDSIPEQDFMADDNFVDGLAVFGTPYDLTHGDTVINTLFHADEAYFRYFNSIQTAILSNGNPFGQPSPIISNVEGTNNAGGIFTGLSYDRVVTIIP